METKKNINFYAEARKMLQLINSGKEFEEGDEKYFENIDEVLKKANELYYNPNEESFMTDKEFDKLLQFRNENSEDEIDLSYKPINKTKVTHAEENLMGTIKKVKDCFEVDNFFSEVKEENYGSFNTILGTIKIDGWSIAFDIHDRKIIRAYSRGQDGNGEDYTRFFEGIEFTEKVSWLTRSKPFTIKCEAAMTFEDFKEYNEIYLQENGKELANPRFAVGSILSNDNGKKYIKYITFFPIQSSIKKDSRLEEYDLIYDAYTMNKNTGDIKFMNIPFGVFAFDSKEHDFIMTRNSTLPLGDAKNMEDFYNKVSKIKIERPDLINYMCDGIVYEVIENDVREELGYGQTDGKACPNFAVAVKFPIIKVKTRITDFEWDVAYSLSGKITPCVRIEPRVIDGRTFDRVSLSYIDRIKKEDFRVGEEVFLEIRGDVLGYVSKDEEFDNTDLPKTEIIKKCPVCGAELVQTKSKQDIWNLICPNKECENKVCGKYINYIQQMRIKGVDTHAISTMVKNKLIENISDLYIFDIEALSNCERFGEKSALNVYEAIQARREVYDYEFIGAWNWTGIARERIRTLLLKVDYEVLFNNFRTLIREEFIKWIKGYEGFSDIMGKNLYLGLSEDLDEIEFMIKNGHVKLIKSTKNFGKDFKSYKIVVTGDLNHWKDRNDFKTKIELMGHKMIGSISKKTDYLVTNTPNSGTIKNKKAKELGIPVVTEEEIIKILGIEL